MKSLADLTVSCKKLIRNIHLFIAKNTQKKDYHSSIEQLFRFCKKLSKQHKWIVILVYFDLSPAPKILEKFQPRFGVPRASR